MESSFFKDYQSYFEFIGILLLLVAVIGLLSVAIFLIYRLVRNSIARIKSRRIASVANTSPRFKELLQFQADKNNYYIPNISIYKTVNSKQAYDRFNYTSELIRYISFPENRWNETAILNTQRCFQAFQTRFTYIPAFSSKDTVNSISRLPYRQYHKIESKICDDLETTIRNWYECSVSIEYTSPAGQNHYSHREDFSYQELIDLCIQVQNNKRSTSFARTERGKMTPALRYEILKRDHFRCVLCGRSPEMDNVTLHVDHIIPVSKGGKTIKSNLRTLCSDCNLGKGAKMEI